MPASIKAFVTITDLIQNIPYVISPLGELSSYSQTFSRDRQDFTDNLYPTLMLNVFKSKNTNDTPFSIGTLLARQCLKMASKCRLIVSGLTAPYNAQTYLGLLQAEFNPLDEASNIAIGSFVSSTTPGVNLDMPKWISWVNKINGANDTVKIWLSDAAFRLEYDEYDIYPVMPLINPATYFSGYGVMSTALLALSTSEYVGRVNTARQGYPETVQTVMDLTYVNPANPAQTLVVPFINLVYGPLGNENSALLRAILEKLVSAGGNTYTSEQWITLFPQLSGSDEFAIIPMWNKVAIPNLGPSATLYKSLLPIKETMDFVKTNFDLYPYGVGLVDAHMHIFTSQYQELVCVAIDNIGNTINNASFSAKYPDYVAVSSIDTDFMRMSLATRTFILTLEEMLVVAETYVQGTVIPNNFRVITRGSAKFIGCVIDFVQYLVAVKSNAAFN